MEEFITAQRPPFVIGLCATAGSLDAIKRFLSALGRNNELCVIVIQPARPDHDELLSASLGDSATMPVIEIEDGQLLKPGHIHTALPGAVFTLQNGAVRYAANGARNPRQSVDLSLRAIAKSAGRRAAGIVFSGDGSDGLLGLEDLARVGALTLAQDPSLADERTMPEAAIAMSVVDVVASPERLAEEVLVYSARVEDEKRNAPAPEIDIHNIREICTVLNELTGHDFRHYKTSTLARRVLRRINVLHLPSADDYLVHLKDNPDEARALIRDLLIGVTAFFRDPSAFEALTENALRPLIEAGPGPIRIWTPGCGTGQEAYSIAMIAAELAAQQSKPPEVQIFATDLDERALNIARRGVYPADIVRDVSPARLERFFERSGRRFQVTNELRRLITFSPHNLISDPPFSRLNLISCRNLMIYLGPHLQKKLMSLFHYALKEDGYLFLGSSESVAGHGELFRVVDSKHRIAQRKATGAKAVGTARNSGHSPFALASQPRESGEFDLGAMGQRIILDEFAPPYAIVDEDAQVVYLSQKADVFLQAPEGRFINNILRMVRSGLRVGLRAAWGEARETRRKSVYEGLSVEVDGRPHRMRLTVQPMPEAGYENGLYMVVFDASDVGADGVPSAVAHGDTERLVEQLEAELLRTRDELERAVQDLEAANEELKSSNEELLSMNEELQSSNEELESSKEEVEAGNQALAAANADLQNLLRSTEIAAIFMDGEGRIRGFTPAACTLYNLVPGDAGRPLSHFTHHFERLELPSLTDGGARVESEAVTTEGRTFLVRVTPYRNADGVPDGTVLTFIDITEQKAAQKRLARAEAEAAARLAELESIYAAAPVGLALFDTEFRYTRVNEALAEINGRPAAEHIGRTIYDMVPEIAAQMEPILARVLDTGEPAGPLEIAGETARLPSKERVWLANVSPILDAPDRASGISFSCLEVTDKRETEAVLKRTRDQLRVAQEIANVGTFEWNIRDNVNSWSPELERLYGVAQGRFGGTYEAWTAAVHPDDLASTEALLQASLRSGHFEAEWRVKRPGGETIWVAARALVEMDESGLPFRMIGAQFDITERKKAEQAVVGSEARLRRLLDNLFAFVGVLSLDGVLLEANAAPVDIAGIKREDVIGKPYWDTYWWNFSEESRERLKGSFQRALAGETVRYDVEIRIADERIIIIDFQLAPLRNETGEIVEIIPSGIDITERIQVERQRELLLKELNHRVNNTLTTIQAIAVLSARDEQSPRAFRDAFLGRLQAMARAHDTVIGETVSGSLTDLIMRQVRPYASHDETALCLGGPEVPLSPTEAHGLGLVLHELATNATKYGALSTTGGTVSLSWTVTLPERLLTLEWVEKNGPAVKAPSRKGFGSRLIEQTMKGLSGRYTPRFDNGGFHAELEFPLSE
ncbi:MULTISPECIES: CheR family methyltransferase [Rhodomicrobium]|uniref:CheR family methyltransferase n=1 Tax=Rhodomicrobium TaxID=1068 RepID=UPI001483CC73|nr:MULTISPECIES: CheR family methyltransferase [Rhodomicrobium]